jgi:acetyl-CoA synthetase
MGNEDNDMASPIIRKFSTGLASDGDDLGSPFTWEAARRELDGLPGGGLNIAHEAVDRHARSHRRDQSAVVCLDRAGRVREYTYGDLEHWTKRFASALRSLGIGKGDRVFTALGQVPELYVAALGTLRIGAVLCPLFAAFGPDPLCARLAMGEGKVLVTTEALYRRKLECLRRDLPHLKHVLLVDQPATGLPPGTQGFHVLLETAADDHRIEITQPEDEALLHFTSGTTGQPKGAVHVHAAVVAHYATARLALDLRPEDRFWCTADPGWVTGTSYGIIAPLTVGATVVADREEFDPERWYGILQEQKVTVWYTAPTAIRLLMRLAAETARRYDTSRLRFLAAVGEPLDPQAVRWGSEAFGLPFHDNWWQTETGAIMIANTQTLDIKPGSIGKPLPGVIAAIVRRRGDGTVQIIEEPGAPGELALRQGWPSMFRAYLGAEERYRQCFAGGWYLTGDLASCDTDGYFWFLGRADDAIKSSGHLIGPAEVERVLLEHPAVAEAAVIGKPDPVAGEIVKAFLCLKPGHLPGESLRRAIMAHARARLGAVVAPKEIEVRDRLPRTRSGKILRRLLKAEELGLPQGDVSTLENGG